MPTSLYRRPWTGEDLTRREIQRFYCGTARWARRAATWIRRPGSLTQARKQETEIWLYETPDAEIVGYGSLGPWRTKDSPPDSSIIPMLAIRSEFQGRPSDQPGNRYSDQIIGDLVAEAASHTERRPLIGLYVDPENGPAIRVYERHFFELMPDITRKDDDGIQHVLMVRRL